jgi:hypothetical protein
MAWPTHGIRQCDASRCNLRPVAFDDEDRRVGLATAATDIRGDGQSMSLFVASVKAKIKDAAP